MSAESKSVDKGISKKKPAGLLVCYVVFGIITAWAGFSFCQDILKCHWFWSACVGVLGSTALFRGLYGALQVMIQSNDFLRDLQSQQIPGDRAGITGNVPNSVDSRRIRRPIARSYMAYARHDCGKGRMGLSNMNAAIPP